MVIKLLMLTDIHDRARYIDKLVEHMYGMNIAVDIVIIAGDLTYFRRSEYALKILKRFAEKLHKPIYFVPGNCDDPRLLDVDELEGYEVYNVHGRKREFKGYAIYGIGGSNITPFNTFIEWSEDEIREFIEKVKDIDRENLIMVTHIPIYGIMDNIAGENVGSAVLRKFLDEHGALLWITGHLHEYSGYKYVDKTFVVNPGPFMRGYYGIARINDGRVDIEIYNFLQPK